MTIIQESISFVKTNIQHNESGHDWWHIHRVWQLTKKILETEKANPLICELGALFHDYADSKFFKENKEERIHGIINFLETHHIDNEITESVIDIVKNVSFSRSLDTSFHKTKELMIVQDADQLDAIGAIGIARAFNYGGFTGRKIYCPEMKPRVYSSSEEYSRSDSPTINHFYEKLLLLKDSMNTPTGKAMAENRHSYMLGFLNQFVSEWEGEI